jgi:hypothetical protein
MTSSACACLGADTLAAKQAIRTAPRVAVLADESHFMASIERCDSCGQHFLTIFCERVDWVDSDDPQTWLAFPVSADEMRQLQAANVAADESTLTAIVASPQRFLYHDTPKGAARVFEWRTGTLHIPGHD